VKHLKSGILLFACCWAAGWQGLCAQEIATLNGRSLVPAAAPLKINIGAMTDKMIALADGGFPDCQFAEPRWCPDQSATDGKHRFCAKAESPEYKALLQAESWALEMGADYTLTQKAVPLTLDFRLDETYELKIFDLDTREWMESQTVDRNSVIGMGITSHDYVLVLTR
jgi:hypothetical protein